MRGRRYWYSSFVAFAICVVAVVILLLYGKIIPDISEGAFSVVKDVVSLIVPIISLVVGTYYARKAMKFQQGVSPGKPKLKLLIYDQTLIPDSSEGVRDIFYCFSVEKNARAFCFIPLHVKNDGETTVQDVNLRLYLPKSIFTEKDFRLKEMIPATKRDAGFKRISEELENAWIVEYKIPEIHPDMSVGTVELIEITCLQDHKIDHEFYVGAVTADGVPVSAKANVKAELLPQVSRIDVCLVATDVKALSNFFIVKSYKSTNRQEIEDRMQQDLTEVATSTDLYRKSVAVIPALKKVTESKDHQQSFYLEEIEQSKEMTFSLQKINTSMITSIWRGLRLLGQLSRNSVKRLRRIRQRSKNN